MTDAVSPQTMDVPLTDTVADRRVHPATVPLRFLKDAPSTVLGLPAAFAFVSRGDWGRVAMFAGALALVILGVNWIAFRRFRYGVGAHDIVIESGLFTRTRRSIPFNRVQDVDIERGPLQRLFGLAKVRIETGGAAADEGLIDSVTLAEADRLRAAVRAGKGVVADPGPAATEVPEARSIFTMRLPRVFLAGLFNFSLLYLAALFGLLQTFKGVLPFDIHDPGRWLGLIDARLGGRVGPGAIAAVLMVALAAGVVFGVARTFATDFGYRLTADAARFRRTRGLFTRSDVVIPKHRVQLALLLGGPLRASLGYAALHFQTLGGTTSAGQRQSVAPLARAHEIAAVLAEGGQPALPGPSALQRVSTRHLIRMLPGRVGMPLLVIVAAGIYWRPALFALAALPLLILGAIAERRSHAYGLTSDTLFIRRGMWRRQLWMIPTDKLQALNLVQSWLQRRLGLASIAVDTAGAPAMNGPAIVDLRLARARELLGALAEARDYSGRKSGTDR